jgi:hypothetical protein
VGEEALVEFLHFLLKVTKDEDDIIPPEHYIKASDIIHEEEEVQEIV